MNLAIPLLLLFLTAGKKGSGAIDTRPRTRVVGKSGKVWFVAQRKAADGTPISTVFQDPLAQTQVLEFAVFPGGVRASLFEAPSTLTPIAKSDFDVKAKSGVRL